MPVCCHLLTAGCSNIYWNGRRLNYNLEQNRIRARMCWQSLGEILAAIRMRGISCYPNPLCASVRSTAHVAELVVTPWTTAWKSKHLVDWRSMRNLQVMWSHPAVFMICAPHPGHSTDEFSTSARLAASSSRLLRSSSSLSARSLAMRSSNCAHVSFS
jgi:hypothetical protein